MSAFKIETPDEQLKIKFYSNLYHSLIKPCDMTGESVLGVSGDVVSDFATLWDQYKTTLPLIYAAYPDMAKKVVKAIINISRTFGKIPCSFGLSDIFPCEEQAKMLGILTLVDAFYMDVDGVNPALIKECTERELLRDDFKTFIKDGTFERFTHVIDTTDALFAVSEITEDKAFRDKCIKLSEFWRGAYSEDGLMSPKSNYYEGDRYTYSFRIQRNMEERIALAGGKERFLALLDDFFGFTGESLEPITHKDALGDIRKTNYHRFEGFNNECDMETPYAYIYADRHDRLSEIIHECVHRSFGVGRSGLPGNNDSGGLSSAFVWNTLGIFPVSGSGEFLIGSPQTDGAVISLAGGGTLEIRVNRENGERIYVDKVFFNGEPVLGYKIPMRDIIRGGILEFFMK